jgi:Protein of unknown function (DUF3592)
LTIKGLSRVYRFSGRKFVADFIVYSAFVIVALSPLLRRLYIERFWIHERGTVIRLEGAINTNPEAGGAWVWTPVIEYYAAGQRFSSQFSYWQRFNAKSKYAVGDHVEILYSPQNPSRFILNSWIDHIILTIIVSSLVVSAVASRSPGP